MNEFILNDQNQINSYGFKIRTDGIRLKRFQDNPVMLDSHYSGNEGVIGKWTNIQTKDGKLTAVAQFDLENQKAKDIESKVARGYIKGASMGISFSKKDLEYTTEGLVLQSCEIFEASIVAIPSNASALRLHMNGKELSDEQIRELCLSVSNSKDINNNLNIEPMNGITLSIAALSALSMTQVNKPISLEKLEEAILELSKDREQLQKQVNTFKAKEEERQKTLASTLIEEAIKLGRITADKKESFLQLAMQNYELAKATLEAIPIKQNFSKDAQPIQGTSTITTMDDFQKLNIDQQLAFKQADPEGYKALLKK